MGWGVGGEGGWVGWEVGWEVGGKGPSVKVEGGWSGREKKTCTFITVYGHSIQKVCVKT